MRPRDTRPGEVHVVTDRRRLTAGAATPAAAEAAFERWLDEVLDAGPDVIQIRERDLDAGALVALVDRLVRRAAGSLTRVVVNDRADVALAARAGGVHLRADGPPAGRVQTIGPASWRVGRSAHTEGEVREARDADYVLVGTIYETLSKPDARPAGPALVRAAAAATTAPVVAIGGITVARAAEVMAAGASGVAAIGLFLPPRCGGGALGPAEAVAALRVRMLE